MKRKGIAMQKSISPYIDTFIQFSKFISYTGKDLLEASGMPEKSSYLFMKVIQEIESVFNMFSDSWKDADEEQVCSFIHDRIKEFSKFIYADEQKVDYFTNRIMTSVHTCIKDSETVFKQKQ